MSALNQQYYVTTDASGGARIVCSPAAANVEWTVIRMIVTGPNDYASGQFDIYLTNENPASKLDTTNKPSDDIWSGESVSVESGNSLIGIWTGCKPNSTYSLTIMGAFYDAI